MKKHNKHYPKLDELKKHDKYGPKMDELTMRAAVAGAKLSDKQEQDK